MTDKKQGRHTDHLRTQIAAEYILILLLMGGIVHLWVGEWWKLETFETENHRINALRMEVHDVYVRVVELSLLGETILEWEAADVEEYRDKRQAVDSLLCRFKTSTLRSVSTACGSCWKTRRSNCAASCACLTSRRQSTNG